MSVDRKALKKSLRTNFDPGPRDALNRVGLWARRAVHLPGLVTGGKLDRPIFIVGAPRSGTSMLYAILRASSQLANWPGEAHEVWEADFHPALRGWSSNALDAADARGEAGERIKRAFYLVAGSRRRLIDKTPRNALRVPFVDALFPDARYVFLVRDGRDNVNSLINAWRTPRYRTYRLPDPHAIPGADPNWWKFVLYPGWEADRTGPLEVVAAKQWVSSNDSAAVALEPLGGRARTIRYEDFVDDPEACTGTILHGLGLPYEDQVRAKARLARTKPINVVTPPESGKWRRENPKEIAAIEELIAPTMERLGYDFED